MHHKKADPIPIASNALEKAKHIESSDEILYASREWISEEWWKLFNDEQLNCFIVKTLALNPTLQAAEARILLADANAQKMRSILFPYIDWGADVAREKLSKTGIIPFGTINVPVTPASGPGRIPVYFTQYETEFNVTYDFDIWGKNRNTFRSALGEVAAKVADAAFTRLQLSVAVAKVYFQLQIDYQRAEIAEQRVGNRRNYFNLREERLRNGIDTLFLKNKAEDGLEEAKQQLTFIEGDIAVHENKLRSLLADDFEEEIDPIDIARRPLPQVPLPSDLPLHLIAKRPDITAQLWLIESADRVIDVAQAGFYPDFSLTAFFGFQTIHFRDLFKWPSTYFNADPAVTLPIFDAGRRVSDLRSAQTRYDLAIYEYNNLVLNAVREVLDGIKIVRNAEEQFKEVKRKLILQKSNYELTQLRVANKIDSLLTALDSEERFLEAYDVEMQALGYTIDAAIALIKALGGGYDACYLDF